MCAPCSGETAEEFYDSIGWKDKCPKCGARLSPKEICAWCDYKKGDIK